MQKVKEKKIIKTAKKFTKTLKSWNQTAKLTLERSKKFIKIKMKSCKKAISKIK